MGSTRSVDGVNLNESSIDGLFVAISHHSPQPMLITNEQGQILYVNPAWERQFGYSLEEVRGQNPRVLQSGKTLPEVYKQLWQTLKAGRPFQTTEVIDKRKDGSFFNLRSTIFPVQTVGSLHYVQILDDITAEKRATEFQKLYLRTAAHDIRTPLQSLRLISDMALMDHSDKNIRDIQIEVGRVNQLASTLLDASQFEAGEIMLKRRVFDISELARSVAHGTHAHAGVVMCTSVGAIMVFADPDRVTQVLTNLIENALKYSGTDEVVHVSASVQSGVVIVSVADNGRGIPEEEQAQLFEPNFRTTYAHASSVDGSGLGLYIVREIVRAHGERLWVDSEPGKGSTFAFTLPLAS